jgi:hypothetical protein
MALPMFVRDRKTGTAEFVNQWQEPQLRLSAQQDWSVGTRQRIARAYLLAVNETQGALSERERI